MIVAGIGCRKNTDTDAVLIAIDDALSRHGLAAGELDALATVPQKCSEQGIRDAAARLGLPLVVAGEAELLEVETLSHSPASVETTGTGSASEAAALAIAGRAGRLLGPRIVAGAVTCAIAVGEGKP
ncbi:cobalamin biosynthesis protein CbiG [Mesorhizobium sp. L-8-10]|uniref:cobalamin biosynthesis protein n=1 Tax=unclassified Mesorhizobium TaxID=325217 RepID=UPI0019282EE1|nr:MULTISPECIES: cobalamin biosynthesis protein [unclassified Mesorhizobium]BCH27486.1 cobalamin biosynthesis protein CbiG [Mesorhizobium sp. L-8-3]BCH35443.1 cobalamin biosynthesis protein CbiG [Mesorhizobium sp. L-8-10]